MLKIAVCAKQVPDTDIPPSQFKVDVESLQVVPPAGVPPIVNGFDMNAVEAALRLRDAGADVEISIFSVGTDFAMDVMKKTLAIGADRLVLVDDPDAVGLDAHMTAKTLAATIERSGGADIVLAGRQASDWDQAHVPIMLSEAMGIPLVTLVRSLELKGDDSSTLALERVSEGGFQRIECAIPAVLTVTNELGEARYANLRGIMSASRKKPETMSLADLNIPTSESSALQLTRLFVPESDANVEIIEGEDDADSGRLLALKMREANLI